MDVFSFPYHVPTHIYPKGDSFKFGRGWEFTAKPQLPVQRRFKLSFSVMQWQFNPTTGLADATINPETNILALINFYEAHYTWDAFIYPHPVFGNITVKFAADAPFEVPKGLIGGTGAVEGFELILVEQGT